MRPDRAAQVIVIVTLITLAGTACGETPEGPTVVDAEQILKTHINKLIGKGVGNVRNIRILDNGGGDKPCGKDRARRTYRVIGDKMDLPELTPVELSNSMFGRLITMVADYDLIDPKGGEPTKRMRNAELRTNLVFRIPRRGVFEVDGATDCLRTH